MAAADLDLLLHHAIRLFMREDGMSADQAFDAAVTLIVFQLVRDFDDPDELDLYCLLLPHLRESILPAYRKPQSDLTDLEPMIQARRESAAQRQHQQRRRRQLGG